MWGKLVVGRKGGPLGLSRGEEARSGGALDSHDACGCKDRVGRQRRRWERVVDRGGSQGSLDLQGSGCWVGEADGGGKGEEVDLDLERKMSRQPRLVGEWLNLVALRSVAGSGSELHHQAHCWH